MIKVSKEKIDWLFGEAKRILNAARPMPPCDGTWLYHPDGSGNYEGIWCNDFACIVDNVPELLPPAEIKAVYYYLIRHQRADGGMPTSVSRAGKPGYITAGKPEFTNSDNSQFVVKIAYDYYKYTSDIELFVSTIDRLKRAMDFVPRTSFQKPRVLSPIYLISYFTNSYREFSSPWNDLPLAGKDTI